MSKLRGIRGATTCDSNSREHIAQATRELLDKLVESNEIELDDVAAVIFAVTEDLDVHYPATVARKVMGWNYVPFLDVGQMKVAEGLARCIRVLMLINTDRSQTELARGFQYLRGAKHLREFGLEEV